MRPQPHSLSATDLRSPRPTTSTSMPISMLMVSRHSSSMAERITPFPVSLGLNHRGLRPPFYVRADGGSGALLVAPVEVLAGTEPLDGGGEALVAGGGLLGAGDPLHVFVAVTGTQGLECGGRFRRGLERLAEVRRHAQRRGPALGA